MGVRFPHAGPYTMLLTNLLDVPTAIFIEHKLGDDYFPWYWNENTLTEQGVSNLKNFQFTHNFYVNGEINSSYASLLDPILAGIESKANLKIKRVFRAKANLLTNMQMSEQELANEIHTDHNLTSYRSFVYYVSNSDGDTVIYNDDGTVLEQASPVFNSGILFPSRLRHRGTPPSQHKRRMVINFILEVQDERN